MEKIFEISRPGVTFPKPSGSEVHLIMIEKQPFYRTLNQQAKALLEGETDLIANLANLSALLNQELAEINWVGFYLLQGETLVLGPFQGKPACVRIPVGRGVCGTAVAEGRTQLIDDVHQFDGHIACDGASNSEIVIPVRRGGEIIGYSISTVRFLTVSTRKTGLASKKRCKFWKACSKSLLDGSQKAPSSL